MDLGSSKGSIQEFQGSGQELVDKRGSAGSWSFLQHPGFQSFGEKCFIFATELAGKLELAADLWLTTLHSQGLSNRAGISTKECPQVGGVGAWH